MDIFSNVDLGHKNGGGKVHTMYPAHNRLHIYSGKLNLEDPKDRLLAIVKSHPFSVQVLDLFAL